MASIKRIYAEVIELAEQNCSNQEIAYLLEIPVDFVIEILDNFYDNVTESEMA